jgi:hypothetical protein
MKKTAGKRMYIIKKERRWMRVEKRLWGYWDIGILGY